MKLYFNKKTSMYQIVSRVGAILCLYLIGTFGSFDLNAQDGATLFKNNCANCHSPGAKKLTGPGLQGFWDRIPGGDDVGKTAWYINWVKNSGTIINSGKDSYINKLYAEYNNYPMTAQPHLSDDELLAIKEYIVTYVPPVETAGSGTVNNPFIEVEEPFLGKEEQWLIGIALLFLILTLSLGSIKKTLQASIDDKEGVIRIERKFPKNLFYWMGTHKLEAGLLILLLTLIGLVKLYYGAMSIGVYQGYQPEQPIKFSHAIHAGENGISCVYCHHSAEKGKHSGIPSVNVCMNCHKGIQEGTWTGTEEISKIYEAAGYNVETGRYENEEKPIEWVRVHNLPDLAYFNHSQHVVVGGIECQTCHGPVEEMTEMYQHAELTMGWCINCHRETEVKMEGNGYYDKMLGELKAKHRGVEVFKVEDIGGLECSKCHY